LTARQVEFKVNGIKQDHAMKLGEGGEAFFVFETSDEIPASLQTSPVVSPATSPPGLPLQDSHSPPALQEPEFLDLAADSQEHVTHPFSLSQSRPTISSERRAQSDYGGIPLRVKPQGEC
jgi:phosphatidate phosphatase LPIN